MSQGGGTRRQRCGRGRPGGSTPGPRDHPDRSGTRNPEYTGEFLFFLSGEIRRSTTFPSDVKPKLAAGTLANAEYVIVRIHFVPGFIPGFVKLTETLGVVCFRSDRKRFDATEL